MNTHHVESPTKARAYFERYMLCMGVLGQFSFYLQGIKIFYTQSAGDVSLTGNFFAFISVASWLVYGIILKNKVLIIANIFAVIGGAFVITGILLYRY